VITYGILGHPQDAGRRLMLLNFYVDATCKLERKLSTGYWPVIPPNTSPISGRWPSSRPTQAISRHQPATSVGYWSIGRSWHAQDSVHQAVSDQFSLARSVTTS
jgi:hypothetical protein